MNERVVKNQTAVELGRRGGLKGGRARAENLTPDQRTELARNAARARWSKPRPFPHSPEMVASLRRALTFIDGEIVRLKLDRATLVRILAEEEAPRD